jgi:hypothetical protein
MSDGRGALRVGFGNDQVRLAHPDQRLRSKHVVGFAFWAWKENGGNTWGVYDASATVSGGCIRPARERQLARVYPRASGDSGLSFHYDSDSGAFTLNAQGRAGQAPTLVYVPRQVRGVVGAGGAVAGIVTNTDAGGGRLASVRPPGAFSSGRGAPGSDRLLLGPPAAVICGRCDEPAYPSWWSEKGGIQGLPLMALTPRTAWRWRHDQAPTGQWRFSPL